MSQIRASGFEPGQRRLNGPQTTGREYRNLSQPSHMMVRDDDVHVPMRDGVNLLADVHRPAEAGRYPVLIAASPYPRQIQDLGAPAGFIEAGASDFFVPRGYVHVIANNRGTSGSGGTLAEHDSFFVAIAAARAAARLVGGPVSSLVYSMSGSRPKRWFLNVDL